MSREMVLVVRCDGDRDELADQTIQFSWRGQAFEVDYCDVHAAEADAYMQRLIALARKVKGKKRKQSAAPVAMDSQPRDRSPEGDGLTERRAIRAWANANGHKVSSHGVIPRDVMDAYNAGVT